MLSSNPATTGLFLLIVAGAIGITVAAARSTKSTSDFLAAGGRITPFQNGLALAGDFMSAGAFLGLSALIFSSGFDGFIYAIGYIASWPIVMFLVADPLRNLGRYTMADALSYRFDERKIRPLIAVISLVLVVCYLIAQMVGAGQVIQLMFGLSYAAAVVLVGALMIFCVMIGGMIATTWVQMVKAVLLLFTGVLIAFLTWRAFGYDFSALVEKAISVHPKRSAILASQMLPKDPLSGISLGLALVFGTAGLPHILIRFFTVKDGKDARLSAVWATGFIGFFFLLLFPIGYGAIALIFNDPAYHQANGALLGGANTVSIHLSHAVGGDFLMAFVCAVAFATIIAVVAGLTLTGASTIAHDLLRTTDPVSEGNSTRGLFTTRAVTLILDNRNPPGPRLSGSERRISIGPVVFHCRLGKLPNSDACSLLAATHDHRRYRGRLYRLGAIRDHDRARPGGMGQGLRVRRACCFAGSTDARHDARHLPGLLFRIGARQFAQRYPGARQICGAIQSIYRLNP